MEFSNEKHEVTPENITALFETNTRLTEENLAKTKEITTLKQSLEEAKEKINWFVEQIKLSKLRKFAAKTETS